MTCQVDGCARRGEWTVSKGFRILRVCGRCRDELLSVFAWKLVFPSNRELVSLFSVGLILWWVQVETGQRMFDIVMAHLPGLT